MTDIARQRLARSFLLRTRWSSGREVVRALGAVQAQDYDGAKWALARRTSGATDEAIEREFTAGSILRTHVLRPTWHFVDPADIRWMLALTGPRVKQRMATYDRTLELDDRLFRRTNAAIVRALRDGAHLTRTEIKAVLTRARIGPLDVQRAAHILMRAELDALICSGARRNKQLTYALLDDRVPSTAPKERDQALLELTRRYFRTRSPATARDFAWWSGLSMVDVKRGLDLARNALQRLAVDGESYWTDGTPIPRTRPSAHLLPNYDEFFIGYRDRSAIGKRLGSTHAVTGWSALISHVIAVDGQLAGGWRRAPGRESVGIHLQLLTRLSRSEQDRLLREVRRYEAFAAKPVELRGLAARNRVGTR